MIVEQSIIQASNSSVDTFYGYKIKFESWITSVENAAQILGQNILFIAFSKMVGSPFTSTYRLRDCLPHLTWDDPKNKFSRKYSTILFNSHATQAFAHLQQGPEELLRLYLHCASEYLSNIHHMRDMS